MAYAMTKRGNLDNCVTYEFMCDTVQDMNDIEDRYRTIGSIAIVLEGYSGMEVYIAGSDKQWRALSAIGGGSSGSNSSESEGAESNLPIYTKTIEGPTIEIENVDMSYGARPQEKDIDFTLLNKGPAIVEVGEYTWEVVFDYGSQMGYFYFNQEIGFGIAFVNTPSTAIMIIDETHTYNEPQTVRIIYPAITRLYSTYDSLYLGANENGENGKKVMIADNNIAIGTDVIASGTNSQAFGSETTASGNFSHAEGEDTEASGGWSHAEGYSTIASGDNSHAEGYSTEASEFVSHAEGKNTQASGDISHAEGEDTVASGYASHAEGETTQASGDYSHAEGNETTASGESSHTEGNSTGASGFASHAEGYNTGAYGYASHAEGYSIVAKGEYQHVSGKYNIRDDNNRYAEIIGNGTADNARSNARALDWNGNEYLKGDLYVGCSNNSTGGTKVIPLPTPPVSDGTYTLQCTISSGVATYSWVSLPVASGVSF